MGRFAHNISVGLLWIHIFFGIAVTGDICGPCVKIEECPSFAILNKHEQQVWLEQNPCDRQQAAEGTTVFEFPSTGKANYVCCPHPTIQKKQNINEKFNPKPKAKSKRSLKHKEIKPNGNDRLEKLQQPENQNQIIYPDDNRYEKQPLPWNAKNIYSDNQNKPNTQNSYSGQQNEVNENIYGSNPNYPSVYNNPPNKGLNDNQQSREIGQNFNGNVQNSVKSQGFYEPNPNYIQYPTNGFNIWNNPRQRGMMTYPGQNFNAYPEQQQSLYNNNGNVNLFKRPNLGDQCASEIMLLPDPLTKCCGQDLSGVVSITDLQNLLNMYAPSNSWSSQNTPQQGQPNQFRLIYPQKQKLSEENTTLDITFDNRIAGGSETELDQFPWTVFLRTTFDYGNRQAVFSCGGSLISRQYVLTAGHCIFETGAKLTDLQIVLAEYDKRTFPRDCKSELGGMPQCIDNVLMYAQNVILHPQYDDDNLHNDIALIRLNGYAPYTRYIRPICLPPINIDRNELSNLPLAVTGWGRNGPYVSDTKQSTVVRLVADEECKKSYPYLSTAHLCAAGRTGEDTCKGDSGGPLMMLFRGNYYVIGIVSGKRADSPCGTRVPSLYTNVYQYVPWIKSIITS